MCIDARSDYRAAEIGDGLATTVQMAQEISDAHCAAFDGGSSQAATTMLYVQVDVANAHSQETILVCT